MPTTESAAAVATAPSWARNARGIAFSDIEERPGGKMPDFCIIGAAKCGTTALNAILSGHPDIFMNPLKEPHYFSTNAIRAFGEQWYRGLYADARSDQICGEASTSYTRYPLVDGTAERMAMANPAMKLIYLLKEPVARVEAECVQTQKYVRHVLKEETPSMDLDQYLEMIEDPSHDYYCASISTSRYIDQIDAFERFFPQNQIMLIMQDDLLNQEKSTLEKIFTFLGVDTYEQSAGIKKNETKEFMRGLDRKSKIDILKKIPLYEVMKTLLPEAAKSKIISLLPNTNDEMAYKFSEQMKAKLAQQFSEPNRRLRARLGSLPETWSQ